MPLIIKHIGTFDRKQISVYEWDQNITYSHNTWEVVKEIELVQLYYHPNGLKSDKKHRMELNDALEFVKANPDFYFEVLPDMYIVDKGKAITIHPDLQNEHYLPKPELLENNRLKNPDLINESIENRINATDTSPIITRKKNISLSDWGAIFTIIAAIVAIWFSVINPIIKSFFE